MATADFLAGRATGGRGHAPLPAFPLPPGGYSYPIGSRMPPPPHCPDALWDSTPDADLLAAAAKGGLATPEGLERAARRMLDDPRAHASPSTNLSPSGCVSTASLPPARPAEVPGVHARSVGGDDRGDPPVSLRPGVERPHFMDLFTADYGFVNGELAAIYGVPAPAREFERTPFPAESERAGVLGQATFLALTAKPDETSPTARGLFGENSFSNTLCRASLVLFLDAVGPVAARRGTGLRYDSLGRALLRARRARRRRGPRPRRARLARPAGAARLRTPGADHGAARSARPGACAPCRLPALRDGTLEPFLPLTEAVDRPGARCGARPGHRGAARGRHEPARGARAWLRGARPGRGAAAGRHGRGRRARPAARCAGPRGRRGDRGRLARNADWAVRVCVAARLELSGSVVSSPAMLGPFGLLQQPVVGLM